MARPSHHRSTRDGRTARSGRGAGEPGARPDDVDGDPPPGGEGDSGSDEPGGDEVPGGDGVGDEPDERQVWCDTCEAMIAIGDLDQDDCCPTCGEPVGPRRVPWKFRLMIAASVVYLGYRAFQGIEWVVHHA